MTKYVLDTNLYVRAFRSEEDATDLQRFYHQFAPTVYLSSIVLHELLAGTASEAKATDVEQRIAGPFKRVGRIVTPTHAAWERAGGILAAMVRKEGLELKRAPKSLVHDALIAASCREAGTVLITDNSRDFAHIARYVEFTFMAAWPG